VPGSLATAQRQALARLLGAAAYEVIPLRDAWEQVEGLPRSTTLTVTALPAKGLETSVELAARLRAAGFPTVIHLAARMVRDRADLARLIGMLRDAGVDRAFVVGGDARAPGSYPDALSLLRELGELGHHFKAIGIACYPQGHPLIDDETLLQVLRDKAGYADSMTTQLCFDARALQRWLTARRSEGLTLPVDIGIPGAIQTARLLQVSARIGVTDAGRFAARYGTLVARLLRPGGYRPDALLGDLAPTLADSAAGVRGLHVFTFNQVTATEAWRRRYLSRL
jgi:methylenetetrahydrofolate reductase (NADPH)